MDTGYEGRMRTVKRPLYLILAASLAFTLLGAAVLVWAL